MTAVDVDALDKLREAATAGPWRVPYPFTKLVDVPGRESSISSESAADAALIVAMHAALPELLAEVRRGRALREAVEGLADREDNLGSHLVTTDEIRAVLAAVDPS